MKSDAIEYALLTIFFSAGIGRPIVKNCSVLYSGIPFSGTNRIQWTLQDKADLIVLGLGANDMLRGIEPKEIMLIYLVLQQVIEFVLLTLI